MDSQAKQENGSASKRHQHEGIKVMLRPEDIEVSSPDASSMVTLSIPQFRVRVPTGMPVDDIEGEFLEKMEVIFEKLVDNMRKEESAMQTAEGEKLQGATEELPHH